MDFDAIKRESEATVRRHGGRICDWLPSPDIHTPRSVDMVVRRSLVLNAMLQIAFNAPTPTIKAWINANGLESDLAASERAILSKDNGALTEQERCELFWSIEALWALVWAGGLISDLPLDEPVGNNLASLCPDLRRNEDGSKLVNSMKLRQQEDLFRKLDLYYRAHWWVRNAQLTGQGTGELNIDIIMERRKALEWVLNVQEDWDNVEMST